MSILESLDKEAANMLSKIPSGKTGTVSVGANMSSIQVEIAQRWKNLVFTGTAGRNWGAGGWTAGAKVNIVW